MKIFLIRHWESFNNISNYLKTDGCDQWLTQKWAIDTLKFKQQLLIKWSYKIFSSPLIRAIETTKILFPKDKIYIIDEFKELNKWFGHPPFNNYTWNEWNKYFESNFAKLSSYYWKYPNWESIDELKNRVLPQFLKIINKYQKLDSIYIITHNWVIKVIISHILNFEIWYFNMKIKNLSIIEIDYVNEKLSLILN